VLGGLLVVLAVVILAGMGAAGEARGQPDSVRAEILEEKGFSPTHSPRRALWRAAAVPGWGQVYNRQYYKLPFVYGGLAGFGFAIYRTNQSYARYRDAARFAQDPVEFARFEPAYVRVVRDAGGEPSITRGDDGEIQEVGPLSGRQLRDQRDTFRRWRDLSVVGTGLFYALTVLDAYVSAHLLTFDVDEDLAVRVRPTGTLPAPPGGDGTAATHAPTPPGFTAGPGVTMRVRF
jgi:hypothetical protein